MVTQLIWGTIIPFQFIRVNVDTLSVLMNKQTALASVERVELPPPPMWQGLLS